MRWDIFCRVVDNYGDIGVTWRLARQLVAEHGLQVRLWVDELAALARVCPQADGQRACQVLQGVEVRYWAEGEISAEPADVVIEAFACELPSAYRKAMAGAARRILWLNLEYLSAEGWVEGCHGLPSLQGAGLQKFFFFPGFTTATGGLLRERDLLSRRDALQQDTAQRTAFLATLGVEPAPGARLISLFAYENPALGTWLDVLASAPEVTHLLVPEGRILSDLQSWAGTRLQAGSSLVRGSLTVQVLPFVEQAHYDALLWCCDLNLVRGEDSFVRAQWAARPLLWHIYPQQDGAHWDKLQAFIDLYQQGLCPEAAAAQQAFWCAWNAAEPLAEAWQQWLASADELAGHACGWASRQAVQTDLATALVQFHENWI